MVLKFFRKPRLIIFNEDGVQASNIENKLELEIGASYLIGRVALNPSNQANVIRRIGNASQSALLGGTNLSVEQLELPDRGHVAIGIDDRETFRLVSKGLSGTYVNGEKLKGLRTYTSSELGNDKLEIIMSDQSITPHFYLGYQK